MLNFLFSIFLVVGAWSQESIKADHVEITWLAPDQFSTQEELIGIQFKIDPEWHVYWKNPGDSGASPKFNMTLNREPKNIGPILWPYPERLPLAHLTNLGYSNEVGYLFRIQPSGESVELSVKLEWLVCQEECIPGLGELKLSRPIREVAKWNNLSRSQLEKFYKKIPQDSVNAPFTVSSEIASNKLKLYVEPKSELNLQELEVFPVDGAFLNPSTPRLDQTQEKTFFEFTQMPGAVLPIQTGFVFVLNDQAWEFEGVEVGTRSFQESSHLSLWILILSALLGGLILNLMPCVLPVLSIKILSLVKTSEGRHLKEAMLYAAGVLLSFVILGGLFLLLRSAGAAIGWGFQLQSSLFVFALILLFWVMALSFLGVFELGTSLMNWAGQKQTSGSFATGVLAVIVATPCTGPFMGTVLGAAATVDAFSAMGLFLSLGLGLASPFVVLAMSPALLKKLPKPGAWMERFKQFFAFPLFGTVIWLLWVLSIQAGTTGWLYSLALLLFISFSIWWGKFAKSLVRKLLWVVTVAAIIFTGRIVANEKSVAAQEETNWVAYDERAIIEARQEGRPVFIDFTAAWCITCQVNKKVVLDTSQAQEIFVKNNTLLVRADWTNHDPVITSALARLGRNSVPVYVFYLPDQESEKILPQILSISTIEDLFLKLE